MGRAPITAVMKSRYFVELAKEGKIPKNFSAMYGDKPEQFFIATTELKERFGAEAGKIPWEAVGLYTYFTDRIGIGLRQLLAGSRKWNTSLLDRNDIAALTERANRVTGIPLLDEIDQDEMATILG